MREDDVVISTEHAHTMARYNAWQNRSIFAAADTLDDAARRHDRGAFFGSIHGTLSHLLWGDLMWMSRFKGREERLGSIKESPALFPDWEDLKARRTAFDQHLLAWTQELDPSWLHSTLTWHSAATRQQRQAPQWFLLTHFFNHQTHHRGQVHAMLTQAGARPEDTDLMLLPA